MSFSLTVTGETIPALAHNLSAALQAVLNGATDGPATAGLKFASEAPAPEAPKKRGRPPGSVAKPAPEAEPEVITIKSAPAVPTHTKDQVIGALVKLINAADALGRNGKQICTDLCNRFGGKNASAIAPERYGEVIAAAQEQIEALQEDSTA